jgi:glyoxylase-like metal-dependent hydrolase (beta-lactamase superfamily II)
MEIIPIDDHITAIDHDLLNLPGVGATYVVRGDSVALIETGTSLTVPATLAGLEQLGIKPEAVDYILCTHIHMDHAGGAGYLAEALPRAQIYINSEMHPFMQDPTRLMASSRRAIGEEAWPLHGDMKPLEIERLHAAENLRLDLGRDVVLEAIATPGHSPDHLSYRDLKSGGLFIGDAAGLVMDRHDIFLPVTPPPTYNLETQRNTIAMLRRQNLPRIFVTHFGPHDNVDELLARAEAMIEELASMVATALDKGEDVDVEALAAQWLPYDPEAPGAIVAECWSGMSVAGMLRYEKKHRQ